MLPTPIIIKFYTRSPFVIVVSVIVRRKIMVARRTRKGVVEMAILAVRVVVTVYKAMIARIVVLVHARIVVIGRAGKIIMRIVGMRVDIRVRVHAHAQEWEMGTGRDMDKEVAVQAVQQK